MFQRRWLDEGKKLGATHTIVVCDTWDYEDYPVHVMPNEDVIKKLEDCSSGSMSKVMEVYNLSLDLNQQASKRRNWEL